MSEQSVWENKVFKLVLKPYNKPDNCKTTSKVSIRNAHSHIKIALREKKDLKNAANFVQALPRYSPQHFSENSFKQKSVLYLYHVFSLRTLFLRSSIFAMSYESTCLINPCIFTCRWERCNLSRRVNWSTHYRPVARAGVHPLAEQNGPQFEQPFLAAAIKTLLSCKVFQNFRSRHRRSHTNLTF